MLVDTDKISFCRFNCHWTPSTFVTPGHSCIRRYNASLSFEYEGINIIIYDRNFLMFTSLHVSCIDTRDTKLFLLNGPPSPAVEFFPVK